MSFAPTQLPTPSDTPRAMDQDVPSPASYYPNHSTSWTPVDSITPISTNPSKKRSRDDEHEHGDSGSYFTPPAPAPEEEPIYGEGMVLINPRTGIAISAESQTGTWYDEKVEQKVKQEEIAAAAAAAAPRPTMPMSRKSMRLSQTSIRLPLDTGVASAPASPPKTAVDHRSEFDEATLALGIGWTKMSSEDEAIQAAARGWARYLDNHYARDIHGAQILLKSSGLNAYLVGAQEGYFLFSEDLLEGKLVGRTWETCLRNLKSQPLVFEGEEVLRAERTPGPEAARVQQQSNGTMMENWADYNRLNNVQVQVQPVAVSHGGMELD
ncbi:hypothetical protein ABEF95_006695 [Exophiala dermatitidis]